MAQKSLLTKTRMKSERSATLWVSHSFDSRGPFYRSYCFLGLDSLGCRCLDFHRSCDSRCSLNYCHHCHGCKHRTHSWSGPRFPAPPPSPLKT